MKPANKIWLNGKIRSGEKTNLYFNQGLNYGACVYEGIRFYKTDSGAAVFRLDDHLSRFFYSASVLRMNLGFDRKELEKAIKNLIKANNLSSGYVRPLSFYSEPKMGINIFDSRVSTVILAWPWRDQPPPSVRLKVTKYRRLSPVSVDLKAKISGYYVNALLGFIEARESGFDEPLFLDESGFIAEGAVNNIFVVKNKVVYTPRAGNILGGITRDTILKIAPDLDLKVVEKDMRLDFLEKADEVFLTGTGIELESVKEIKNFFLKRGGHFSVAAKLSQYYRNVVRGRVEKYQKWLSPV